MLTGMLSRAHSCEDGFSLIEVMFAALLLTVGLLGVFVSIDSSNHLTSTAQRQQVAAAQAEKEMEILKGTPYASLAMSSPVPVHANDTSTNNNPSTPDYWVSASTPGYLIVPAQFNDKTSGVLPGVLPAGEPFVTGGTVASTSFTTDSDGGNVSYTGTVYRYVTRVNDCGALLSLLNAGVITGTCPTTGGKRLTIGVVLDSKPGLGANKPVYVTTVVADPAAALLP